jgi:hypothetical protein
VQQLAMNCSQQAAVLLNNEGVHMLRCGYFEGAIHAFQRGLSLLKEITTSQGMGEQQHMTQGSTQSNNSAISFGSLEERHDVALGGLQRGLCFVYDRPVLLKTSVEESTVLMSSTVLLFNFGLACHQCWMQTGSEDAMRRATEIYQLILRVLVGRASHEDDGTCGVLQCLVLNNLAHLHFEACEYLETQYCMEGLRDLILWEGWLDEPCSSAFMSDYEREELKLNLLHIKTPSTAQAA